MNHKVRLKHLWRYNIMSKLAFIWAEDQNHLIGKGGNIPWFLPADLKFFKDTTKGHPVVMGRRTFDSLNIQPLPARKKISF